MSITVKCDLHECGANVDGECSRAEVELIEATHGLMQCANTDIFDED
jgi:hypothetical protein